MRFKGRPPGKKPSVFGRPADWPGDAHRARPLLTWQRDAAGKPIEYAEVVLSPRGRYLLARRADNTHPELFDLARAGRRIALSGLSSHEVGCETCSAAADVPEPKWVAEGASQGFGPYVYGFSPRERNLLIERIAGKAALVDLERGTCRVFAPGSHSPPGFPAVWSPDGRYGSLPSGVTVDVTTDAVQQEQHPAASQRYERWLAGGYLTPEATLRVNRPLRLFGRADGVLLAKLLEGGAR